MTVVVPKGEVKSITKRKNPTATSNIRRCPSCELITLSGMPGGRDAVCPNCGYKDPCCYD